MTQTLCIVDAYSTGAELAPLFRQQGWRCIHVQTTPTIPADYLPSYRPETFDTLLALTENTPEAMLALSRAVAACAPTVIIPGTETGVELADYLSTALGTAGNRWQSSALRRDKYRMQEALRNAGLRAIRQHVTDSLDEAISWAQQLDRWPVVVKPVDSAGADGVRFCHDVLELTEAFNNIYGKHNKLGLLNRQVLLQERLVGRQYIVNGVSIDGRHLITEMWSDDKKAVKNASLICEKEVLLPWHGEVQEALKAYMLQALTALGIENGPSHSELMMTADGPVLIETAARMQGTIMHDAVVAALGYSHVTLTAERYLAPAQFAHRLEHHYQLNKSLFCVTLASDFEGTVKENRCEDLLGALDSFYGVMHTPAKGEKIWRTTDLFTNPGIIYLCHDEAAQVEKDYVTLRELEKQGSLFELV